MTNEEIVKLIKADVNASENLWLLYNQNIGLINITINRYNFIDNREDLMQEAFIGLAKAVNSFDDTKDIKFSTYLVPAIKSHLLKYYNNFNTTHHIPTKLKILTTKYKNFTYAFYEEKGRQPTEAEYCKTLNIKLSRLKDIETALLWNHVRSLSETHDNDENTTFADVIKDDFNLEEYVMNKLSPNSIDINLCINSLDERSQYIIMSHFKDKKSLTDIAKELNLSRERVRQIEAKAIKNLRRICKNQIDK